MVKCDRIEEDLARRDFTINAMAFDPLEGVLVDPFGGLRDLEDGVLRVVVDDEDDEEEEEETSSAPARRLSEDGLRVWRAYRFLDDGLANVPGLTVPEYPDGAEPIYMSFVVHHENRDGLMSALRARGVDTTTGYMNDLSDHELFQAHRRPCPNAAKAMAQLLHIPVHPNLTKGDVDHLIESVRAATLETTAKTGVS